MKKTLIASLVTMVFLAVIAILPTPTIFAQGPAQIPVNGWMWSDNVGWFAGTGVGGGNVSIDPTTGDWSGYAWSDGVGWVNFAGTHVSPAGGAITGTAQACSVFVNGCSGTLKTADQNGGWTGLITMASGASWNKNTGVISGYAWGDLNLGWLDLSGLTTNAVDSKFALNVKKADGATDVSTVRLGAPANFDIDSATLTSGYSSVFNPGTSILMRANTATCWSGCGLNIDKDHKSLQQTCILNDNETVFVGCGTGTGQGSCSDNPASCGCTGSACGPSTCTDDKCVCTAVENCTCNPVSERCEDVPNNVVVNINTGSYAGIKFFKEGALPYPAASFPFNLSISGTISSLGFDWSRATKVSGSGSFPTDCGQVGIISSSQACGAGTATVSTGGTYKLCFPNKCLSSSGTIVSRYNGVWNVPITVTGGKINSITVNGSASGNIKLDFSDATHQ